MLNFLPFRLMFMFFFLDMSCLLSVLEQDPSQLTKNCRKNLSRRREMWEYAAQVRTISFQNLTLDATRTYIYEWMNECLMTPQHKNKSAVVCQTNDIYVKSKNQICIY